MTEPIDGAIWIIMDTSCCNEALFWHSQEMSLVLLECQEQRPEGGGR